MKPTSPIIIVQARLNSRRLNGKVLLPALGKPMLQYTLERLMRVKNRGDIIVATSVESSDDPIASFVKSMGFPVFRGSLEKVSDRYVSLLKDINPPSFVRICGDSPFIDPKIVECGIEIYQNESADLVTNLNPRSFPKGQSAEIFRTSAFLKGAAHFSTPDHFEHVTTYFYENAKDFHIRNFSLDKNWNNRSLCVDDADEFRLFNKILEKMVRPHWEYGWEELLELAENLE